MKQTLETKPKVTVILGPTAVGKTKLGIEIAKEISASIVSADSLQVYKYFDIGTAKPTQSERREVPHHLIDIVDPEEEFNAGTYRKLALEKIGKLLEENRNIVIVGGTFLYVKVLLSGLLDNIEADQEYRKMLKSTRDEKGIKFLHEILEEIDPVSAEKINKNDYVRIERALEVYHVTGELMSQHQNKHAFEDKKFDSLKIGLFMDRDELRNKIDYRVDEMIENGLIEETKSLLEKGYGPELKPMQSIGYKQVNEHLRGNLPLERAVDIIKRDTKRFAKRQMTWLRADNEINWFNAENEINDIIGTVNKFYS